MEFTSSFLDVLGRWMRGWKEDQALRLTFVTQLEEEAAKLPSCFRTVNVDCYRKRYLTRGDISPLIRGDLDDGVTSWTTDQGFAEFFKGLERTGTITATIFKHRPEPSEVVLSIAALWENSEFQKAVQRYIDNNGIHAEAFQRIGSSQSEIVLRARLRYDEIIAFTGRSSPFDELCDAAGITLNNQDEAWKLLLDLNKQPDTPRYVSPEGVKRILNKVAATGESFGIRLNK
ncbi:hypothetical protein RugamoR57_03620 [Duganella caerulea]|uniref:hypothetical protein n=1 Tax=Duganella caerulea TaxID=2885762 RepID=UPI0030E86E41